MSEALKDKIALVVFQELQPINKKLDNILELLSETKEGN